MFNPYRTLKTMQSAAERITTLELEKDQLERRVMGLRRGRERMLCPFTGLRHQGYAEGLAEGIKQGREAAQREELERTTSARVGYGRDPLHEHDFAALELRVLALELAGQLPDDWIRGSRTRGVWAGTGPSLQNLPRRAKHEPEYRYFRSAAGNFRWRFRVGSHMDTLVMVSAGPVAKWEPSVKTVRQVLNDSRFIHLGSEPKWHG